MVQDSTVDGRIQYNTVHDIERLILTMAQAISGSVLIHYAERGTINQSILLYNYIGMQLIPIRH